MKMVMLVYNETLSEEVETLLARLRIEHYTEMSGATGHGATGGAHLGDRIFPSRNNVRFMAMPCEQAEALAGAIAPLLPEWKKEGCKLFIWDCAEAGASSVPAISIPPE